MRWRPKRYPAAGPAKSTPARDAAAPHEAAATTHPGEPAEPSPRQDWDAWPGIAWPTPEPDAPPVKSGRRVHLDWGIVIGCLFWGTFLAAAALVIAHGAKEGERQRQAWLDNGPRIETALNARYDQQFQYYREIGGGVRWSTREDTVVIDGVHRPDCRAYFWDRDTQPTLKCDQPVHLTETKATP